MSILDMVRIYGYSPAQPQFPVNYDPALLAQQHFMSHQQSPYRTCPHENCPICKQQEEARLLTLKINDEKMEKKQLEYKGRCKEYIERFRAKRTQGGAE